MVSIGTIFSVIVVGAAIAGGYALYRNADKIGGAFSRGVETNLTIPIGNYFDNLWNSLTGSLPSAPQGVNPATIFDPLPSAYGSGPGLQPSPTPVPVPQYNYPGLPPSYQNPPASNLPNPLAPKPIIPTQPLPQPKATYSLDPTKAGYYYIDYEGTKYDTQWKLSAYQAPNVAKAAAALGDALFGIKYIGQSKLTPEAFQVFGESQNYL